MKSKANSTKIWLKNSTTLAGYHKLMSIMCAIILKVRIMDKKWSKRYLMKNLSKNVKITKYKVVTATSYSWGTMESLTINWRSILVSKIVKGSIITLF
jgi:hypothetical protein